MIANIANYRIDIRDDAGESVDRIEGDFYSVMGQGRYPNFGAANDALEAHGWRNVTAIVRGPRGGWQVSVVREISDYAPARRVYTLPDSTDIWDALFARIA